MKKTIKYEIRTAHVFGKIYYNFDDTMNSLKSTTSTTIKDLDKCIRAIIVGSEISTSENQARLNQTSLGLYINREGFTKLIAADHNVNPADIKLYTSDIPLENIEKGQLTAVISVEPPSEGNGQASDVTVLAEEVYSTMDIAKEYRMDIWILNQYLEYRNVQYLDKNKYHLYGRLRGKGLILDMPTMKYLRWTEKGRKFVELMLEQDGYKKVMRKHG